MTEGPIDPGDQIQLRGVRVHNLKDLSVDIPRDLLVVLTGVSGSGKSSLAFDTLHAEGRRRYLECLSTHARQFLEQVERPDADAIEGLPPTVAIDQKSGAANPRSTVGTLTEIHDYLRLLFARVGLPHCPACRVPIRRQTPEQIVASALAMPEGRKVLVLAPLARGRKGRQAEAFQAIRRSGLIRARVDGQVVEVGPDDPPLAPNRTHDVEAVVDRLVLREGIRPRLSESIELALKVGDGTVVLSAMVGDRWEDSTLSTHHGCPGCGLGLPEIEPRVFSFNSPRGACPTCDGLGSVPAFDVDLLIPDRSRSLQGGAVAPWTDPRIAGDLDSHDSPWVKALLKRHGLRRTTPLDTWTPAAIGEFLEGPPEADGGSAGLLKTLAEARRRAGRESLRRAFESYQSPVPCPSCGGARLGPEGRSVQLGGRTLPAVCALSVSEARRFFDVTRFEPNEAEIGAPIAVEISRRLAFLERVGLDYLTLDRASDTLSGGELQRARLASQVGSGLVGICYILDEPTTGLHPRDTDRLLAALIDLRDQGNSVLVVEHDEAMIRAADWLIDLGPGAGPEGGRVVAEGPPAVVAASAASLTARYLRAEEVIAVSPSQRLARSPGELRLRDVTARNLKGIDVVIPAGTFCCVTGVSGSGKSTLVLDVLARAARRGIERRGRLPEGLAAIEGDDLHDKLILIDQGPIGRGPRSTPATVTGVFDQIRKVFARAREAKLRGYKASRFSFNTKEGRCQVCQGHGVRRHSMSFLPDLSVRCDACGGLRFNPPTLEIQFKGRSIGDVLALRVDESRAMFAAHAAVLAGLDALEEAGLGYLTLGQPSQTLSGGEAQRVKLAAELARPATGRTLYLLDEPTTGLHFHDVARLLQLLHRLADLGNTVVVIEHNLDVIQTADWLIDLGPGGGIRGGELLAQGPPTLVAQSPSSITGPFLKASPDSTASPPKRRRSSKRPPRSP